MLTVELARPGAVLWPAAPGRAPVTGDLVVARSQVPGTGDMLTAFTRSPGGGGGWNRVHPDYPPGEPDAWRQELTGFTIPRPGLAAWLDRVAGQAGG